MDEVIKRVEIEDLVRRLRREVPPNPEMRVYGRYTAVPVNPDGHEAADCIEKLIEALDRIKDQSHDD